MAEYAFTSVWRIETTLEPVYQAVYQSLSWPEWWTGVERVVELEPGDEDGIGSIRRYTWKGRLPYRLTFDILVLRIEPLRLIEGMAYGELEGHGSWRFTQRGDAVEVCHTWHVRTNKRWMNLFAPVARPLFGWNHHLLMRQGGERLAASLNARLIGAVQEGIPCLLNSGGAK